MPEVPKDKVRRGTERGRKGGKEKTEGRDVREVEREKGKRVHIGIDEGRETSLNLPGSSYLLLWATLWPWQRVGELITIRSAV